MPTWLSPYLFLFLEYKWLTINKFNDISNYLSRFHFIFVTESWIKHQLIFHLVLFPIIFVGRILIKEHGEVLETLLCIFEKNLMLVWNLFTQTNLMIESSVSLKNLPLDLYIVCFHIPPISSTGLTTTVQKWHITERKVAYYSAKYHVVGGL